MYFGSSKFFLIYKLALWPTKSSLFFIKAYILKCDLKILSHTDLYNPSIAPHCLVRYFPLTSLLCSETLVSYSRNPIKGKKFIILKYKICKDFLPSCLHRFTVKIKTGIMSCNTFSRFTFPKQRFFSSGTFFSVFNNVSL